VGFGSLRFFNDGVFIRTILQNRVGGYPSGDVFLYGDYFFTEFIAGGLVGFQANVVLGADNMMLVGNGRLGIC